MSKVDTLKRLCDIRGVAIIHGIVHAWATNLCYSIFVDKYAESPNKKVTNQAVVKQLFDPHMRDIWINGANGRWRIVLGADLALRLGTPGDGTRKFANCYRFMKEIIANGLLSVLTEHTLLVDMAKTGKQYYQQPWRYGKAATYAMINGLEPEDFKENAMFENVIAYAQMYAQRKGIYNAPCFMRVIMPTANGSGC